MRSSKFSSQDGFSLIELLMVVLIIGLLAAIVLPIMNGQRQKARMAVYENRSNIAMKVLQADRASDPNNIGGYNQSKFDNNMAAVNAEEKALPATSNATFKMDTPLKDIPDGAMKIAVYDTYNVRPSTHTGYAYVQVCAAYEQKRFACRTTYAINQENFSGSWAQRRGVGQAKDWNENGLYFLSKDMDPNETLGHFFRDNYTNALGTDILHDPYDPYLKDWHWTRCGTDIPNSRCRNF